MPRPRHKLPATRALERIHLNRIVAVLEGLLERDIAAATHGMAARICCLTPLDRVQTDGAIVQLHHLNDRWEFERIAGWLNVQHRYRAELCKMQLMSWQMPPR